MLMTSATFQFGSDVTIDIGSGQCTITSPLLCGVVIGDCGSIMVTRPIPAGEDRIHVQGIGTTVGWDKFWSVLCRLNFIPDNDAAELQDIVREMHDNICALRVGLLGLFNEGSDS